MLKKPLPGPARLMLGAGLAVLTSSAAATVLWQQQPATVITLPAIAMAAAPTAMPVLPSLGRVRVPYPEPTLPPLFVGAAASTSVAAASAPVPAAAPEPSVAPLASPSPRVAAASVAAPAAPAPQPVATVAPMAAAVAPSASRAPLALPTPPAFVEPIGRIPLPPPPTPRGEISAPEPKLSVAGGADPADADYVAPRVLVAKPARLPRGARVPQPQVAAVSDGEVLRDERVLRPADRQAYVPRDALVASGLVLQVALDARGKLVDAKVHENQLGPIYARNALAAIKRWRFEPARRAGQPEASTVLVPVWFEWDDGGIEAMKRDQMSHPKPMYQPAPQPIAGQ